MLRIHDAVRLLSLIFLLLTIFSCRAESMGKAAGIDGESAGPVILAVTDEQLGARARVCVEYRTEQQCSNRRVCRVVCSAAGGAAGAAVGGGIGAAAGIGAGTQVCQEVCDFVPECSNVQVCSRYEYR